MGASIRGHVGDTSFSEALDAVRRGGRRMTLFVASAGSERLIHLGRAEALVLRYAELEQRLAPGGPCAPLVRSGTNGRPACEPSEGPGGGASDEAASEESGSANAPYREAATRLLEAELSDVSSWTGAPFELLEGPLPRGFPNGLDLLRIRCAPAEILASPEATTAAAVAKAGTRALPDEPAARIEALHAAAARPAARHVAHRELAATLKELGQLSKAAASLRAVARHYVSWGQEELAADTLVEALEACPVDLHSLEDLLSLRVDPQRRRRVDAIVARAFGQLELLKQYDLVVRLFRILDRPPEDAAIHRLVGESLIRGGETAGAIQELLLSAKLFSAARDREGAERIYGRLLEIDPSFDAARSGLRALQASRKLRGLLLRWGTLAAAIILAIAWVLWDVSSAAALTQIRPEEKGRGLRGSLALIQEESRRFPFSRHPARLARVEEGIYREAFARDRESLGEAIAAEAEGDFARAHALYSSLESGTVIPLFAARASAGRKRVVEKEEREALLLRRADEHGRNGNPEEAFHAYRELLFGVDRRGLSASPIRVPILVETVPPGATIEHQGQSLGTTPGWIGVPLDPQLSLRLWKEGYQPLEIQDPLERLLAEDTPRFGAALSLPRIWWSPSGGGLVTQAGRDTVFAVTGADGVLRAFNGARATLLWESPFEVVGDGAGGAIVAGPAVVAHGGLGNLFAFSLSSGKLAWTAWLGSQDSPAILGQAFAGQVVAVSRGQPVLINPVTGLPVRRIGLGREHALGPSSVCGSTGVFALRGGGLAGANLRTGQLEFVRWKELGEISLLFGRGADALVVRGPKGLVGLPLAGGDPLWQIPLRPDQDLAVAAGRDHVCVVSGAGEAQGIDGRTGEILWSEDLQGKLGDLFELGEFRELVVASIHRSGRQTIVGISSSDGSRLWEVETGPPELAAVRMVGQLLIVSTPTFGVVAFATGS
jgi:outer membrane protein assembly factor BamB/tetratricopeptide (TPR) repeat protein